MAVMVIACSVSTPKARSNTNALFVDAYCSCTSLLTSVGALATRPCQKDTLHHAHMPKQPYQRYKYLKAQEGSQQLTIQNAS